MKVGLYPYKNLNKNQLVVLLLRVSIFYDVCNKKDLKFRSFFALFTHSKSCLSNLILSGF